MNLLFPGSYIDKNNLLDISITLIEFKDEDDVFFVYSPHLDLSGYGKTKTDARKSFSIVVDDFLSYTHNKKTLYKELQKLGWKKSENSFEAPKMNTLILERSFLSDLFDKYPVITYHQKLGIPSYV